SLYTCGVEPFRVPAHAPEYNACSSIKNACGFSTLHTASETPGYKYINSNLSDKYSCNPAVPITAIRNLGILAELLRGNFPAFSGVRLLSSLSTITLSVLDREINSRLSNRIIVAAMCDLYIEATSAVDIRTPPIASSKKPCLVASAKTRHTPITHDTIIILINPDNRRGLFFILLAIILINVKSVRRL